MAVITPSSLAGFYGATAQRAPSRGRQYIPSGKETEAQRLARESNERMNEASRKDRMALGITSAVLSGTNMLLQAGLKGWELGRDPAAVRSQVAQAEMLGQQAEELGSRIDMSRLEEPVAQPAPGVPAPIGGTEQIWGAMGWDKPAERAAQQPAAATREPLAMSRGELEQLISAMPEIRGRYGANGPGRGQLIHSLRKRGVKSDDEAEALVKSMVGQGDFLEKNWQQMEASNALQLSEGEPTGFWDTVAKESPLGGWLGPMKVSEEMAGKKATMPEYLSKLATIRDKTGDNELLAKVAVGVLQDPTAGPQLLAESKAANPGTDWDALAVAAAKGDVGPIIKAWIDTLSQTPDEMRAETPVAGLEAARALFGEDGEPRIPLSTSIHDIRAAIAALKEVGEGAKASRLLEENAWGRAHDWKSVVPNEMAARPGDAVPVWLSGGKAESGMSGPERAKAMFKIAQEVQGMKLKEYEAETKRMKARKPVSLGSHVDHKARTREMSEEDWKASWRARKEFATVLNALGEDIAEEKLDQAYKARKSKSNPLYTAHVQLSKVNEEEVEAQRQKTKDIRTKVTGKSGLVARVNKAKKRVRELKSTWSYKTDGATFTPLRPEIWLKKELAREGKGKRGAEKEALRQYLNDEMFNAAPLVDVEMKAAMEELTEALEALSTYESAGQ